jgi:hypothetical protein
MFRAIVLALLAVGVLVTVPAAQTKAREGTPLKQPPRTDRHGDPLPCGAAARLGSIRWRAPASFRELAFSPDGKTVAALTGAGLYLFDLEGKLRKRIAADGPLSGRPTFSPDGSKLAC